MWSTKLRIPDKVAKEKQSVPILKISLFRWIPSHQFQYLDLCTGKEGPQEQIHLESETLKSEFQMTAAVSDQPN